MTFQNKTAPNLVWMDLEMSGLNPEHDVILEIATVVTDANLKILGKGPVIAIHQPENILNGMDDWNIRHHTQSGRRLLKEKNHHPIRMMSLK